MTSGRPDAPAGPGDRSAYLSPWTCRLLIVLCAVAAYGPPLLQAELNQLDDHRFILENSNVHELSLGSAWRFFTDPSTLDPDMWQGTYRPLRTLDFAIDWAIGGEEPLVYHLHSLLIHLMASILAFEVFRRLLSGALGPSVFGALLFALHPAHTECVAWVTSRGDVLVGMFFLAALLLHLNRRFPWAVLLYVLALFSKESAVVFPAAVLLADLFVRRRGAGSSPAETRTALPWRPYLAYAVIGAAYYLLWRSMMENADHVGGWWGGTYFANLTTMARGLVYYAKILVLPVLLVFDYHVPAATPFDAGALLGVLLAGALVLGCVRGKAPVRFAAAWFVLLILPTSNLIVTVGIPTAERFLYLPSLGLAFLAADLLTRVRPGRVAGWGAASVVVCFGLLTFARAGVWKDMETLYEDTMSKAATPRTMAHRAGLALNRALAAADALDRGNSDPKIRQTLLDEAGRVVRLGEDLIGYYDETLGIPPGPLGGEARRRQANALLLLGRNDEALRFALSAVQLYAQVKMQDPSSFFNAALAADRVATGLLREPGERQEEPDRDILIRAAELFFRAAELFRAAAAAGHTDPRLSINAAAAYVHAADARLRAVSEEEPSPDELQRVAFEYFLAAEVAAPFGSEAWGVGRPDVQFPGDVVPKLMLVYANAASNARNAARLYAERGADFPQIEAQLIAGEAFRRSAYLHELHGELPRARELFLSGAQAFDVAAVLAGGEPRSVRKSAHCLGDAGRVAERVGDVEDALELYRASLGLDPDPGVMDAVRRLER